MDGCGEQRRCGCGLIHTGTVHLLTSLAQVQAHLQVPSAKLGFEDVGTCPLYNDTSYMVYRDGAPGVDSPSEPSEASSGRWDEHPPRASKGYDVVRTNITWR